MASHVSDPSEDVTDKPFSLRDLWLNVILAVHWITMSWGWCLLPMIIIVMMCVQDFYAMGPNAVGHSLLPSEDRTISWWIIIIITWWSDNKRITLMTSESLTDNNQIWVMDGSRWKSSKEQKTWPKIAGKIKEEMIMMSRPLLIFQFPHDSLARIDSPHLILLLRKQEMNPLGHMKKDSLLTPE